MLSTAVLARNSITLSPFSRHSVFCVWLGEYIGTRVVAFMWEFQRSQLKNGASFGFFLAFFVVTLLGSRSVIVSWREMFFLCSVHAQVLCGHWMFGTNWTFGQSDVLSSGELRQTSYQNCRTAVCSTKAKEAATYPVTDESTCWSRHWFHVVFSQRSSAAEKWTLHADLSPKWIETVAGYCYGLCSFLVRLVI